MGGAANATETVAALVGASCARLASKSERDEIGVLQKRCAIFRCDARLELVRLSL